MRPTLSLASVLALLLCLALPAPAAPPAGRVAQTTNSRLRVARDAGGKPRALQTELTHITLGTGQQIDLVSALHLGEASYYADLNRRFTRYDVVLYELVVSGEGASVDGPVVIPRDDTGASGLSQVQMALCRMLGLKFQLHAIDYAARNFRRADLTYEEFQRAMARSGESTAGLLIKIIQVAMSSSTGVDERELEGIDLIAVMTRGPSAHEQRVLRRLFATCFPEIERLTAEIQGTTIIAGRNQRALEVLARELKAGRRRVAVFYGAGHMADLERRVMKLPGARVTAREWLDAWLLGDLPSDRR